MDMQMLRRTLVETLNALERDDTADEGAKEGQARSAPRTDVHLFSVEHGAAGRTVIRVELVTSRSSAGLSIAKCREVAVQTTQTRETACDTGDLRPGAPGAVADSHAHRDDGHASQSADNGPAIAVSRPREVSRSVERRPKSGNEELKQHPTSNVSPRDTARKHVNFDERDGHALLPGHAPSPGHASSPGHGTSPGHASSPGHSTLPNHATTPGHDHSTGNTHSTGHSALHGPPPQNAKPTTGTGLAMAWKRGVSSIGSKSRDSSNSNGKDGHRQQTQHVSKDAGKSSKPEVEAAAAEEVAGQADGRYRILKYD